MRGRRVSGHVRNGDACSCGWAAASESYRGKCAEYAEHLAAIRAQRAGTCRECGHDRAPEEMSLSKPSICKPCATARIRAWAEKNPNQWETHRRKSWLKQKYGLTPEGYDNLLASQGGVCAICGAPPSDPRGFRMHVDHDHKSGRVRGILCGPCNQGIGNLGDDIKRLQAAVDYLGRQ